MLISELIEYINEIKPNAFPNEVKISWLNEVEGMVWTDIMLLSPLEYKEYAYNDKTGEGDCELLVIAPHSKLYNVYLCAMIDFYNSEYDKYQNSITLFNAYFGEFSRWYAMHYRPADGDFKYMGMYISAYGIAVKHGFEGTEEEWLDSLAAAVDEEMVRAFVEAYLEANPIGAPVTSVNGKTGDVELTASDVGALTTDALGSAIDDALAEAKASGEFDGQDGKDGTDGTDGVGIREVKQTTTSTASDGKNVVTVYLTDGNSYTFTVYNGAKGADGTGGGSGGTGVDGVSVTDAEINENGELILYLSDGSEINVGRVVGADGQDGQDGVGISSVKQTTTSTTDGGTNVVTVTLTNGATSTFQFKNGSKGYTGDKGDQGEPGAQGKSIASVTRISGTGAAGTYDTYEITLDDGTAVGTFEVYNGADGEDGADGTGGSGSGERGSKIFYVDYPQLTSVSGTIGNVNPRYSLPIGTLTVNNPNIGDPLAGDVVLHEYSKVYAVLLVKGDTVYLDEAVNIKGATGERGSKILKTTTRPSSSTVDWDDGLRTYSSIHVDYLKDDTGVTNVKENDVVWYDTYFYSVARVEDDTAYLGHYVDLKGAGSGGAGQDGVSVTGAEVDDEGFLQITLSTGEVINAGYVVGANGQDGADGQDGVSVTGAEVDDEGFLQITLSTGEVIDAGYVVGTKGKDGADGVGIKTVKQTTTSTSDGGTNVVTVTLTNGSTATFQFKNGSKGSQGEPGVSVASVERSDGTGEPGTYDTYAITLDNGTVVGSFQVYNALDGADGYTPVKGTDYWTAADKAEMVSDVLAALPTWTGGSY